MLLLIVYIYVLVYVCACVCVFVCVCVHVTAGALQGQKLVSDALKLQVLVSHSTQLLGSNLSPLQELY